MRAFLQATFFALAVMVAPVVVQVANAADSTPVRIVRAPGAAVSATAVAPEETVVIAEPSPLLPQPVVRYGCKRIWRCDAVVCEWRRGCFGTYGYMEGPYYTLALAKRQYEQHGWPVPGQRSNVTVSK